MISSHLIVSGDSIGMYLYKVTEEGYVFRQIFAYSHDGFEVVGNVPGAVVDRRAAARRLARANVKFK